MKDAPKPEKKKGYYLPTILLGIIVAAIFLLAIFTYQVPATERALVLTMGKITKEAEPGLHLRLPLPFQQVIRYDIRKRPFDGNIGHLEETTTRDQKQVVIGLNVIYRIKDLKRFKEAAPKLETALGYLGGRMRTAKAAVVGKYDYDQLINTDPELMKIEQMRAEILEMIAPDVMEKYGLEVSDVLFSSIGVGEDGGRHRQSHEAGTRDGGRPQARRRQDEGGRDPHARQYGEEQDDHAGAGQGESPDGGRRRRSGVLLRRVHEGTRTRDVPPQASGHEEDPVLEVHADPQHRVRSVRRSERHVRRVRRGEEVRSA